MLEYDTFQKKKNRQPACDAWHHPCDYLSLILFLLDVLKSNIYSLEERNKKQADQQDPRARERLIRFPRPSNPPTRKYFSGRFRDVHLGWPIFLKRDGDLKGFGSKRKKRIRVMSTGLLIGFSRWKRKKKKGLTPLLSTGEEDPVFPALFVRPWVEEAWAALSRSHVAKKQLPVCTTSCVY